jgi:hypothetical protein
MGICRAVEGVYNVWESGRIDGGRRKCGALWENVYEYIGIYASCRNLGVDI